MSYANITIHGHLGKDPESRQVGEHTVVTLSVAVTRVSKRQGQKVETTTWWYPQLWGARGEAATKHLRKGDPVLVSGWPELRTWKNQENQDRSRVEIINAEWAFAGGKRTQDGQTASGPSQNTPAAPEAQKSGTPADDEPPF